jgi:hypothetical protein
LQAAATRGGHGPMVRLSATGFMTYELCNG